MRQTQLGLAPSNSMLRTAAVLLTVLVLPGCATASNQGSTAASETPDAAPVALPTTNEPEGVGDQAALTGVLVSDEQQGCVWLEVRGRNNKRERFPVEWPSGFSASGDPVVLYRPDGSVVAREGDRLHTAGGGSGRRTIQGCTTRFSTFTVSEVEKVERAAER